MASRSIYLLIALQFLASGAHAGTPNLTASSSYFSGPYTYFPSTTLTLVAGIQNNGSTDSGSFVVRFFYTSDPSTGTKDVQLGDAQVIALTQGASINAEWSGTIPTLTPGKYYFVWKIDALNQVVESDETDNYFYNSESFTVPQPLSAPPIAFPAAAVVGQPVVFSVDPSSDMRADYVWNFGDGKNGEGASPFHAYAQAGTYTATVAVYTTNLIQGGTVDITVSGDAPAADVATQFQLEILQLELDEVLMSLGNAIAFIEEGDRTTAGQHLKAAEKAADEAGIVTRDPGVKTYYGKKAKGIYTAAVKLRDQIFTTRTINSDTAKTSAVVLKSVLKMVTQVYKNTQSIFKALPVAAPTGTAFGPCPFFMLEEVKGRSAGFHKPGDIVAFRVVTKDKSPLPADSRLEVTGVVIEIGITSPAPMTFSLTMGPNTGGAHVIVRCGSMRRCRLLFNKAGDFQPPQNVARFDGSFAGDFKGSSPYGTISDVFNFSVLNGAITLIDPSGSGTVTAAGAVSGSGTFSGEAFTYSGTLKDDGTGSGTWTGTYLGKPASGTWTVTKK